MPEDCVDRSAFSAALEAYRAKAGLSFRGLAEACEADGVVVVHGTVEGWFKGRVVRKQNEPAFRVVLREIGIVDVADQDSWVGAARKLRTRRVRPTGVEPFRGLESYNEADAEIFYGRETLIERVLGEVDTLCELGGGAVLLTGASGVGKSSLLKAGVIPALSAKRPAGHADRPVLFISAGVNPMDRLAEAVAAHLRVDVHNIAAALRGGSDAVADVCQRVVAAYTDLSHSDRSGAGIVLIVDQLEQAMVNAESESGDASLEEFIAVLHAMTAGPVPTATVLGVRLDFLNAALLRRSLRDLAKTRPPVVVGPMNDDELARVIEHPAHRFGVKPEPGFVEVLLGDVSARDGRFAHQAGTLPLLSHALRMTWRRGEGKQMTVANYRAVGGVDGALRESAEKTFADLSVGQQTVARRMFYSLVHVQASGAHTRRQIPQDDLLAEIEGSDELEVVLDRFVAQRLLTIDEDTVEITHDALMVAWPELRAWLDADRGGRLVAQQLVADARAWDRAGRPDAELYRGTRLQGSREWRERHPEETTALTRAFLDAAVRQSRRVTRRLRLTVAVLAVLVLITGTLAGVVFRQAATANQQRDQAQSRSLASQVRTLRDKDPGLARQLALAAYRIADTTEARSALIDATALPPAVRMLGGDNIGIMYAVAIHPSGTIAAAAAENTVRLWDITNPGHPTPRPDPPAATCGKIYALAFSPNGNLLAASCGDGSIHLWDTHDPRAVTALPALTGLGARVYSLSFSPDGDMMAAAIAEPKVNDVVRGSVRLWAISGDVARPLGEAFRVDDDAPAKSVAFHPAGAHLAVGTDDGTVQLWDISDPRRPGTPVTATGSTKGIGQLAFSPDGDTLAAGSADFLVHLWSTVDPRAPVLSGPAIDGASTWINAIAFSPDGATLAIASSDSNNGLRLYDMTSQRITATMPHPSPVTSVRFSPDGTEVITGANDGTARIWPVSSTILAGMDYLVSAVRFSPRNDILAVGSGDLRLFDTTDPQHPRPLGPAIPNPDGFSGSLAFSPDNQLLAESHGRSGTLQIWNVTQRSQPTPLGPPLRAHTLQVETVAFNRDSTLLATGSRDGTVRLWDVRTPEAPVALSAPGTFDGFVNQVAFSPTHKLLVAGSTDKTIRLWDISDPRKPTSIGPPLTPANHYVYSTVFSPDGTMLAVSLADSTTRLYDITDPAHPETISAPLTGPEGYVLSIAFNTDGTALATTAGDGTVWLWDLRNRSAPGVYATLTLGTESMYPVDFLPGTDTLAAGGGDKKVWIWTTRAEDAAALVCATSGDPITRAEWAKYVPDRPYTPPCQ